MIRFRGEGEICSYGFNVYPWRERCSSIGFILRLPHWRWRVRYAPKRGVLYNDCECCHTIEEERRLDVCPVKTEQNAP